MYILSYARAGMIEGIALRYFNIFGPRQDPYGPYAAVVPALFSAAVRGVPMGIFGDGLQTRDFTYVDNAIHANMLAATRPAAEVSGRMVNVGAGQRASLLELVRLVGEATGREVALDHRPPRGGDVRDSLASLERARAVLGYEPMVALPDGIGRLWEWLREHPEGMQAPSEAASR
jgi:UDP-glucose 4-epimerase